MPFIDYNTKPKLKIWEGIYGKIQHSATLTCAHISIDAGIVLPEHQHPHEQWSHLLEGEMEFTIGGEKYILKSGVTAYIPGHVPHSGRTITACKLIDVFSPVREDWIELEKKQLG
jgi:quercetin dioxygenase-like cupin family protein